METISVTAPQQRPTRDLTHLSAEAIQRRRAMAERMLNEASSAAPVQHWTQAASRVLGGVLGGMEFASANKLDEEKSRAAEGKSKADSAEAAAILMGLYPGQGGPEAAVPAGAAVPAQAAGDRTALAQRLLSGSAPSPQGQPPTPVMAGQPQPMAEPSAPPQAPAPAPNPAMQGLPSRQQLQALLSNPQTRPLGIKILQEIQARQMGPSPMDAAKLQNQQLENQLLQQKLSGGGVDPVTRQRAAKLEEIGIDPDSAEGMAFLANGKLPAAAYEQIAQRQRRQQTAPKIAEGLQNLNAMADTYDDASFGNAVGPFQGSTPDGLLGSIPINMARLYGEADNYFRGGNTAPSEVRSNIQGSTEALAAAIKPLIRAPGEGVWTDQDQARLVSVVGDLAQARTKEEFRRRLNAVKDRVKSNFDLDIEFDALGKGQTPQMPKAPAASGFKYMGTAQ